MKNHDQVEGSEIRDPFKEQPFLKNVYFLKEMVSKFTRSWLKCMLNGLGGDLVDFFDSKVTHILVDTRKSNLESIPSQLTKPSLPSSEIMVPSNEKRNEFTTMANIPSSQLMSRGMNLWRLSVSNRIPTEENKKKQKVKTVNLDVFMEDVKNIVKFVHFLTIT